MNHCDFAGTLVSATRWLPSAPFDHRFTPAPSPIPGCNRVRCGDCDSDVRNRVGIAETPAFVPRFAYGTDEGSPLAGVEPEERARLYYCRCLAHTEYNSTELDGPGVEPGRGFVSNWRCQGHPPLEPGSTVDGDRVDHDTLVAVVERRLADPMSRLPDGLDFAKDCAPTFWLSRLHGLLSRSESGQELAQRLEATVLDHVLDPDAGRRCAVLNFVYLQHIDGGLERIVKAARQAPDKFQGKVTIGAKTVDDLGLTLAVLASRAGAFDLLKELVLTGAAGRSGLLDVSERDHAWLLDHAVAVYRAQPTLLSTLVRQIARGPAARTTTLVRELVRAGADTTELRNIVERYLAGPAGDAVLRGLA